MRKEVIKGLDIVFHPKKEHRYTLIWMHGLGDTAFGWSDVFETFPDYAKIILPTAPTRKMDISPGFPVTGWYSLKSMIRSANLSDYLDIDSLKDGEKLVKRYIDDAIKEVGEKNVIVGGFSQGGMMATYCGLQYQHLKGIINLVAPLFPQDFVPKTSYKNSPVFCRVGLYDEVIPIKYARQSWKDFKDIGELDYKECEMGHELIPEVLHDLQKWVEKLK